MYLHCKSLNLVYTDSAKIEWKKENSKEINHWNTDHILAGRQSKCPIRKYNTSLRTKVCNFTLDFCIFAYTIPTYKTAITGNR